MSWECGHCFTEFGSDVKPHLSEDGLWMCRKCLNSRRAPVAHYAIPSLNCELIDIIRAKAGVASDPWRFFLWASCLQYLWRYDLKGEPRKDIDKAKTYLAWLSDDIDAQKKEE